MKFPSTFSALVSITLCKQALAWGAQGHQAVGYVAMGFLAPNALDFVEKTLTSKDSHSLGPAATWADEVRSQAAYKFTAPFHYVDAEDSPLDGQCSVLQARDCNASGCILSAISNYTQRVSNTRLSKAQRAEALKFLDHFIGDIGQPLHVEAHETGGNGITAICGGKQTNLHAAWDTGMIQTYLNANFGGSSSTWADSLISDIKSGAFRSAAKNWISCSSVTQVQKRQFPPRSLKDEVLETIAARSESTRVHPGAASLPLLQCPLLWARESNTYDCSNVFNFKTGQDLCTGAYYNASIPVINQQIAKQGYRLAAWLNVIFDGETSL